MDSRKCIAVLTQKPSLDYQSGILKGIYRSAFSHDVNVAVMCVSSMRGDDAYYSGEMEIFSLLGDYSRFAGVIYLPDTIDYPTRDRVITEKLVAAAKERNLPAVVIGSTSDVFPCYISDDTDAIRAIIDHLIDEHGCRDIAFLTGRKGHPHAEHRLEIFRREMADRGLPVRSCRTMYGDFWRSCGEETAKKLLEDGLPEALICANSYMADGVYSALYSRGIRIPKDIKLACYGEMTETSKYMSATMRNTENVGFAACEGLFTIMGGGTIPKYNEVRTDFIERPSLSCGCIHPDEYDMMNFRENDPNELGDFFTEYNSMTESFIKSSNMRETMWTANWYTHLFGDFSRFSICMCDDVVKPEETLDENRVRRTFTDELLLALDSQRRPDGSDDRYVGIDRRFRLEEVYPPLFSAEGEPAAYVFRSLHFIDRCYGFAVLSYGNKIEIPQANYDFWVNVLANSVESQRRLAIMTYLYKKVNRDAVTDFMTGLYNRNGFNEMLPQIAAEARSAKKSFLLIMSDLNGLKYVNDNFGHAEGDVLIRTAGEILSQIHVNGAECEKNFRIGGDEFVKAVYGDIQPAALEEFRAAVRKRTSEVNSTSGKPYPIYISLGMCLRGCDDIPDCDKMLSAADEQMYIDKQRLKKETGFDPKRK